MELFSVQVEECLIAQHPHLALTEYLHPPLKHDACSPRWGKSSYPVCSSQCKLPIWELLLPSWTNRRTEPTSEVHPTGLAQGVLHICLLRAPLILPTLWGSPHTNTAVALTSLPSQVEPRISPFGAATGTTTLNNSWKATTQVPSYRQFLTMHRYPSVSSLMCGSIIRFKGNAVVLA